MASAAIEAFVKSKQGWIREKSVQMAELAGERKEINITEGSMLPLLGREYPVIFGNQTAFDGSRFVLCSDSPEERKEELVKLYQSLAGEYLPGRVSYFSGLTGWMHAGVRIGKANTYWGSCSGKNKLNFSWKLILAEPALVDYVIVHELAHTSEHNHTARFWRLVQSVLPDFKERRARLGALAKALQKQGWN
jgi:predicted metal-dependent hydrolase